MVERRKFPRKGVEWSVVCHSADDPKSRVSGKSTDISMGGIGMKLNKTVKEGSRLNIRIQKSFWEDPIEVKGEVIWRGEVNNEGYLRAGVQFTDMPWTLIGNIINSLE